MNVDLYSSSSNESSLRVISSYRKFKQLQFNSYRYRSSFNVAFILKVKHEMLNLDREIIRLKISSLYI
jgi:hypothetical protein